MLFYTPSTLSTPPPPPFDWGEMKEKETEREMIQVIIIILHHLICAIDLLNYSEAQREIITLALARLTLRRYSISMN